MTVPNETSAISAGPCPECGCVGSKVKRRTLAALLTPFAASSITDGPYRFCGSLDCTTVYFAENGSSFSKADLTVRVGVKEREAPRPLCYCFDHSVEEILAEIRETGQSTVLDDIKARMKTACWCETKSPQGSCCLGTVNGYVRLALAEHGDQPGAMSIDVERADCCAAEANQDALPSERVDTVMPDCCSASDGRVNTEDQRPRQGMMAAGGSILSALAASACCWIPFLLISFGVSAGGVSAWFEQYRWLFLSLTTILLGFGFYSVYFRKPRCTPGSACTLPHRKLARFNRVMLWVAMVVVIAAAAFPKYVGYLIPGSPGVRAVEPVGQRIVVSLGIEGMTCEACSDRARNVLLKVDGVLDVEVSYSESNATISIDDAAPPSAKSLADALESIGYKAGTSVFSLDGSG